MTKSTEHMDQYKLLEFEAETMRQFKNSDAYKILYGAITRKIQENTARLMDRRVNADGKIQTILGELRALNDMINAIEEPQRNLEYYKQEVKQAQKEIQELDYLTESLYEDGGVEYRGAGGAL